MPTRRLLLGSAALLPFGRGALAQSCTSSIPRGEVLEPGKWTMSINPTLPPQQFVDARGDLQGLNVELARAMAGKMCLEPVFMRMDFPPMIPGLRSGRFDTINTGMFWTEERSRLFYMVPYAQQAISVYTLPDSRLNITRFDDLSGRVVGIETATYNERKGREANAEMVARGLRAIDIRTFSTASETVAALRAGQLEAALNIDETAREFVSRGVAKIWLSGLFGTDITFAFRSKPVAEAAAAALTALKAEGTYDRLFDKFGMTRLTAPAFAIRGPGPT